MKMSSRAARMALGCFLAAVAGVSAAQAGEDIQEKLVFRLATIAPKGVGWGLHFENLMLPELERVAGGEVSVKVFWGGVLGDEMETLRKMNTGALQGAGLSGLGTTLACPPMAVVELPFLFRDYDEVDYIKEKMTGVFEGLFRENGLFLFAWCDQDFDVIISINKPFTRLADFQGTRFMAWYGPLEERLLERLGAVLVPTPVTQIASGAVAGAYEAAIGPCVFLVGAQLHGVVRHINPCRIRYSPTMMVLTNEAWASVPEPLHAEYLKRRTDLTREYNTRVRQDNARTLEALYSYGIAKDEFSPVEQERLRKATSPLWEEMAGKLYTRRLLREVLGRLEEHRQASQ